MTPQTKRDQLPATSPTIRTPSRTRAMTDRMRTFHGLLLTVTLSAFALVACGDDDDEATPPEQQDGGDSTDNGGRGGKGGGKAGNGSAGSGSEAGDGGVTDGGSDDPAAGEGGGGTGGSDSAGNGGESGSEASCIDDPEEGTDFLNRCSESQCEPFDNEDRVPRLAEGLPDP